MASTDLITVDLLRSYLSSPTRPEDRFSSPADITVLTGGSGNFTYRIHLADSTTAVLKHSTSYVASNAAIPFSLERWKIEQLGLQDFPHVGKVKVPELYFSDEANHVLIMEDAGVGIPNLKQLLGAETVVSVELAEEIGRELAAWLFKVHAWGRDPAVMAKFENPTARGMCAWRTFGRIQQSLAALTPPYKLSEEQESTLKDVCGAMQKSILTDSTTVTMGDFWTGNVLVKLGSNGELEQLYLLDYELAHPGAIETDLSQMSAEIWLSSQFAKLAENQTAAKKIEEAFMADYVKYAEDHVNLGKVNVCKGGHVGTWVGMVGWSTDLAKVAKVSGEGMDMVWKGWQDTQN